MNLILEKSEQVKFYTNMEDVLTALGNICCEFDWYISDIEVNKGNIEEGWYFGVELEKILNAQNIQFIWAVFSAVPVGFRRRITNIPFVNNNPFTGTVRQ